MTKDTRASEQRSIQPAHECIVVPVIYSVNPFFSGLKSDLFIPSPAAVVGSWPIKGAAVEWLSLKFVFQVDVHGWKGHFLSFNLIYIGGLCDVAL